MSIAVITILLTLPTTGMLFITMVTLTPTVMILIYLLIFFWFTTRRNGRA